MKLTEDNAYDLCNLIRGCVLVSFQSDEDNYQRVPVYLEIPTLEGTHRADVNKCWIVRGIQGEYYPVRNDIFEATYEEVSV